MFEAFAAGFSSAVEEPFVVDDVALDGDFSVSGGSCSSASGGALVNGDAFEIEDKPSRFRFALELPAATCACGFCPIRSLDALLSVGSPSCGFADLTDAFFFLRFIVFFALSPSFAIIDPFTRCGFFS